MPTIISGDGTITGLTATGISAVQEVANASITPAKLTQPFTAGTAVASTSGTSINFTSIPSWVKRITVMFSGVSTNGTSTPYIRLGDAGGIETTGYSSIVSSIASSAINTTNADDGITAGFPLYHASIAAADIFSGTVVFTNLSGNLWTASGTMFMGTRAGFLSGTKTLSDVLTQVRFTTVSGTDTFDAGTINILYE